MEKNDILCAITEGLGSNGEGVIRHEGVTFFVPACLPGEKELKFFPENHVRVLRIIIQI